MSGRRRAAAALGVALLLATTGCGSSPTDSDGDDAAPGDGGGGTAPADGPTTLQRASASSPPGTTRVVCTLRPDQGPVVRFALDLPGDVRARRTHPTACGWGHPERVPREHYTTSVQTYVQLVGDQTPTLQHLFDVQEPDEVEGDSPETDDSILHLELDHGVTTFGRTVGDRLTYTCYCDGQNLIYRYYEADGVRVTWYSVVALAHQTDAEIGRALAGAGTMPG